MKKIILIGTGNIGKRYLQAIHTCETEVPVICYDRKQQALSSIGPFLEKNGLNDRSEKVSRYESATREVDDDTLVIVATTAEDRAGILLDIIKKEAKYIISEKPVSQTEIKYDRVLEECNRSRSKIYVNYYLRFQPFVEKLRELVDLSSPFQMDVRLPGNGIACNGIHFLDLFLWLSGMQQSFIKKMNFEGIYEQKRKGFWDLYGEINLGTSRNDSCSILNEEMINHQVISIDTKKAAVDIYEEYEKMSLFREGEGEFRNINSLYASEYLVDVVRRYASGRWDDGAGLTPLAEAMRSHRILFQFLRFANCPGLNIT